LRVGLSAVDFPHQRMGHTQRLAHSGSSGPATTLDECVRGSRLVLQRAWDSLSRSLDGLGASANDVFRRQSFAQAGGRRTRCGIFADGDSVGADLKLSSGTWRNSRGQLSPRENLAFRWHSPHDRLMIRNFVPLFDPVID
jgi:hypothetical protein